MTFDLDMWTFDSIIHNMKSPQCNYDPSLIANGVMIAKLCIVTICDGRTQTIKHLTFSTE